MMFAMRFAGIAALSALSMASSYSWLNCPRDVWYITSHVANSAIRKYISVARCATGRYSSHASVILTFVSAAVASFSFTSCAVCFVLFRTSMSSTSSKRLPVELARRNSRSSSSCLIFFLYEVTSSTSAWRCCSSSYFSLRMSFPSSWSSRPTMVTVKSMTSVLALSSGE